MSRSAHGVPDAGQVGTRLDRRPGPPAPSWSAAPGAAAALSHALDGAPDPARELWKLAGRLGAPRSPAQLGMHEVDISRIVGLAVANPYAGLRPVTEEGVNVLLEAAGSGRPPGNRTSNL